MQQEVVQWLARWFSERKKYRGDSAKLETLNYFEAGLLTSLEVIEFVTEIEEKFSVRFSEEDFQDPRFVTIGGLAELVADHAAQPQK